MENFPNTTFWHKNVTNCLISHGELLSCSLEGLNQFIFVLIIKPYQQFENIIPIKKCLKTLINPFQT